MQSHKSLTMKFNLLETVILATDLSGYGLKAGARGTVVELYSNDMVEVLFVNTTDYTPTGLTLGSDHIRPLPSNDSLTPSLASK
jgi:hypothetical protein